MVCLNAPVNAPFSWPNSSLSSNVSGIAAQLIGMNGAPAPPAELMNCTGEQLLSGTALAKDQDGYVGRRDLLDIAQHPQHLGAVCNDAIDR